MTFEEKKAVSFVLLTDIRRYLVRLPLTLEPERPHQATCSSTSSIILNDIYREHVFNPNVSSGIIIQLAHHHH